MRFYILFCQSLYPDANPFRFCFRHLGIEIVWSTIYGEVL